MIVNANDRHLITKSHSFAFIQKVSVIVIFNSSFTDFPFIKLPPETDFLFKEDP